MMRTIGAIYTPLAVTGLIMNIFNQTIQEFTLPFQASDSFVDHFCYLCSVTVMLSSKFISALWSPAWKGLTSWFSCM